MRRSKSELTFLWFHFYACFLLADCYPTSFISISIIPALKVEYLNFSIIFLRFKSKYISSQIHIYPNAMFAIFSATPLFLFFD
jgi:hypothetical protein